MNHHSLFPKNPFLLLLPVACTAMFAACAGSGDAGTEANGKTVDPSAALAAQPAEEPAEYDMSISSKHRLWNFDLDALDSTRELFKRHFQVEDKGLKPLTNTVCRIPWDSIVKAGDASVPTGKAAGIYFFYGLDATAFHPVIRFVYQPAGGTDYLLLKGKAYSVANGQLVEEPHPDRYEQAYKDNIRIDRFGDGNYTKLKLHDPKDSLEDPFATWFQYPQRINELLNQNPTRDSTMLVVSCISEHLEYGDLAPLAESAEYRHLLALHVGQGMKTDLLGNRPSKNPNLYKEHAMDMGTMCPPNCNP